jgi:hypothetical protein
VEYWIFGAEEYSSIGFDRTTPLTQPLQDFNPDRLLRFDAAILSLLAGHEVVAAQSSLGFCFVLGSPST